MRSTRHFFVSPADHISIGTLTRTRRRKHERQRRCRTGLTHRSFERHSQLKVGWILTTSLAPLRRYAWKASLCRYCQNASHMYGRHFSRSAKSIPCTHQLCELVRRGCVDPARRGQLQDANELHGVVAAERALSCYCAWRLVIGKLCIVFWTSTKLL